MGGDGDPGSHGSRSLGGNPEEPRGWFLGPGSLCVASVPWVLGLSGTSTHPEPGMDFVGSRALFPVLKEVGHGIPSFSSCPVSCVELCKDSARQPGWRPQRSVWLPLLLLRPRGLLCRHTTPRDACSSTMERQVTQLKGLGITLALVRGTSGILFPLCPPWHQCEHEGITRVSTALQPPAA